MLLHLLRYDCFLLEVMPWSYLHSMRSSTLVFRIFQELPSHKWHSMTKILFLSCLFIIHSLMHPIGPSVIHSFIRPTIPLFLHSSLPFILRSYLHQFLHSLTHELYQQYINHSLNFFFVSALTLLLWNTTELVHHLVQPPHQ